jgi:hypothetical protein
VLLPGVLLDWLVSVLETVPVPLSSRVFRMQEQCGRWALWFHNISDVPDGTTHFLLTFSKLTRLGHSWD